MNEANDLRESVREHYEPSHAAGRLVDRVRHLLAENFSTSVTAADFAPMDQFHTRGLAATRDLAALARIRPEERVLDAGCGLGGPARLLAETCGCHVTGVDLTPSFIEVAHLLTERTGLTHLCRFETGDLTALDFPDASFDVVWTQHVVMNIAARDQVYAELRRVLRPGGRLAFYDILAADAPGSPSALGALEFPLPWSKGPSTSHLLTEAETRAAFTRAGLHLTAWQDLTDVSVAWIDETAARGPAPAGTLSLATFLGPGFPAALANLGRNFHAGRLRVAMGLATAVEHASSR